MEREGRGEGGSHRREGGGRMAAGGGRYKKILVPKDLTVLCLVTNLVVGLTSLMQMLSW